MSACEAVKGGMSKLCASIMYNVSRTTLKDHMKEQVKHRNKPGSNTYLTMAEEEELASFLMEVSELATVKHKKK